LGESRFALGRFLPGYLRWYLFAFGRRLSPEQLRAKQAGAPIPGPSCVAPVQSVLCSSDMFEPSC
jgi:hypothetical protein